MVEAERFGLVQRDEHFDEELLVLCFQRQCKPIDYAGKKIQSSSSNEL